MQAHHAASEPQLQNYPGERTAAPELYWMPTGRMQNQEQAIGYENLTDGQLQGYSLLGMLLARFKDQAARSSVGQNVHSTSLSIPHTCESVGSEGKVERALR